MERLPITCENLYWGQHPPRIREHNAFLDFDVYLDHVALANEDMQVHL